MGNLSDLYKTGAVSQHNAAPDAHADLFDAKVDKVTGKTLSTEDYTTAEKTKLSGIAAGAEVNVNADWNATSGDAQILNKPTIPDAQIQADWNQTTDTAKDYIKNKPTIPTNSSFTLAGLSEKSYANLTDKPTIPAAQVQSDWNALSGMGQILNKPTIPSKTSDLTNDSGFITSTAVASGYVAKETGYSLVADAQITKLGNLPVITSIGTGLSLASGVLSANIDLSGYSLTTHTHSGYQATITGAATTITTSNMTASRALVSDSSGKVAVSAVTANELGYLSGVTSAVQTQLNGKSDTGHTHSYLSDAPTDGSEYVRKNGAWSVASGGAALATTTTAGIVQIGTNISVLSGVISVATASTSALGVARFSSNYFTVASGIVSIKLASTSVKGVAEFSPSYFSVSSGVVSILETSTSVTGAVLGASSAEVAAGTSTSYRAFTPAQIKSMVETFASSGVPSGSVLSFAGSGSVPSGFLLCNGAAVSRTTYANLYSAIGTLYGVGDGSTTFNLPDFRGRFLRGYDGTRSAAIGTAQADGLPNIAGGTTNLAGNYNGFLFGNNGVQTAFSGNNGAFSITDEGYNVSAYGTANARRGTLNFNASSSNSIYGNSSYVTPYNYAVQYIIKY